MALLGYAGRSTEDAAPYGVAPLTAEELPGVERFWLLIDDRPNAARLGRLGPWPADNSGGGGATAEGSGGGISVV